MRQTSTVRAYIVAAVLGGNPASHGPMDLLLVPTDSAGRFYWLSWAARWARAGKIGHHKAGDGHEFGLDGLCTDRFPYPLPISLPMLNCESRFKSGPNSLQYPSSAVVNRLPLRAHKEKTVRRFCFQGNTRALVGSGSPIATDSTRTRKGRLGTSLTAPPRRTVWRSPRLGRLPLDSLIHPPRGIRREKKKARYV